MQTHRDAPFSALDAINAFGVPPSELPFLSQEWLEGLVSRPPRLSRPLPFAMEDSSETVGVVEAAEGALENLMLELSMSTTKEEAEDRPFLIPIIDSGICSDDESLSVASPPPTPNLVSEDDGVFFFASPTPNSSRSTTPLTGPGSSINGAFSEPPSWNSFSAPPPSPSFFHYSAPPPSPLSGTLGRDSRSLAREEFYSGRCVTAPPAAETFWEALGDRARSAPLPLPPSQDRTSGRIKPPGHSSPSRPAGVLPPIRGGTDLANMRTRRRCCQFCKNNGERESVYRSHPLKDDVTGLVVCPVLSKYVCDLCGKTGKEAHTRRYCPLNPAPSEVTVKVLQTSARNSAGKRRPVVD